MSAKKTITTDLVTIEVAEVISDVLQRISVLHAAFVRVLTGTRLVEVVEADYDKGKLVFIAESRPSHHPRVAGKVCVYYTPLKQSPEEVVQRHELTLPSGAPVSLA